MAALAGGSLPFLAVLILFLVALIIALYTRTGSGIDHHPFRNYHGGSPGADRPCDDFSGADRTSFTEQAVRANWRRSRANAEAARAAAVNRSRQKRQRPQPAKQSRKPSIPSPVPPLR
jgi:hypothetical protein